MVVILVNAHIFPLLTYERLFKGVYDTTLGVFDGMLAFTWAAHSRFTTCQHFMTFSLSIYHIYGFIGLYIVLLINIILLKYLRVN